MVEEKPQKGAAALNKYWLDRLQIYTSMIDSEQSIRTNYQSLLTSLEVFLFGLFFTLFQLNLRSYFWVLPTTGIIFCVIFWIACDFRAKNVDFWRNRIIHSVEGTVFENDINDLAKLHNSQIKKTDFDADVKEGVWQPFFDRNSLSGRLGRMLNKHFGHWFENLLIPLMIIIWLMILLKFASLGL